MAELRARREELNGRIRLEEAEQSRLEGQIVALTEELLLCSENLARLLAERGELDRIIDETEAAYDKVPPARGSPPGPASCRCRRDRAAGAHAVPGNGRAGAVAGLVLCERGESVLSESTKLGLGAHR